MFRSADKPAFDFQGINIPSAAVITDLDRKETDTLKVKLQDFLSPVKRIASLEWHTIPGTDYSLVSELLSKIAGLGLGLLITYRNLKEPKEEGLFSMGVYLEALVEKTKLPILVLPHPAREELDRSLHNTDRVMAVTDHLAGDDAIVNYGVLFTKAGGSLFLSHIEDGVVLDRYSRAIEKIPDLRTDHALEGLRRQLLKEPRDFINSCVDRIRERKIDIEIEAIVKIGHRMKDYRDLVEEHEIDLLILEIRDENRLAMRSKAYAMAVEFRDVPLLLL